MTRLIIDAATSQKLSGVNTRIELVDPSGKIVGHFVPVDASRYEPILSEEELQRREEEGGGRSLAEILADLEKRG